MNDEMLDDHCEHLIDRKTAVDWLEPNENQFDAIRDARVQAVRVLNGFGARIESALSRPGATLVDVATAYYQCAYALGLNSCDLSMTERAEMLGIQRATISKGATAFCAAHDLEPSWAMKREGTADAYAEARRESIIRTNAKLNGELPTVPNAGRSV